MPEDTTPSSPFLGPCGVCGGTFKSEKAVSTHLGRNPDPAHRALLERRRTDPQKKIAEDRATALAMFQVGYSVLRYSGDEIRSGFALSHLERVLSRLSSCSSIYRNWCPDEEQVRGR